MKPTFVQLRISGILLCLFALAACGPRTPNAAAETPFIPTSLPTSALAAPSPTAPPEAYPGATVAPPPTTAAEGYPAATTAPEGYPDSGATATPAADVPTIPPPATNTNAPVFITYRDFEIVPAHTTIKVGTTVNFLIQGGEGSFHQPYAGASAPFIFEAPPNMSNGVSWPHAFDTAQTLTLLCGYHGNMTATLIVEP